MEPFLSQSKDYTKVYMVPRLLPKWHLNLCRHLRQVWHAPGWVLLHSY